MTEEDPHEETPESDIDPVLDPLLGRLARYVAEHSTGAGDVIPAGHPPPSPASLDDVGVAHAIDGDGTALCRPGLRLEQVDGYYWDDVPSEQRCLSCAAVLMSNGH
ncbi:MAG TPA: hypothetical protein VME70_14780 [Mycobacteriales bacterium]|nr:hypothetical protein [Mycobacteriales bacterium]